jgi:hypothetical protein
MVRTTPLAVVVATVTAAGLSQLPTCIYPESAYLETGLLLPPRGKQSVRLAKPFIYYRGIEYLSQLYQETSGIEWKTPAEASGMARCYSQIEH